MFDFFKMLDLVCLFLQIGQTRKTWVSFNICKFGGFDLIIANLPIGLLVPHVSFPPNSNPSWNEHNLKNIEALFEFADGFLTDDVPLLLFLP